MIVFTAIAPHSPLLLPTIGKDHRKKLKKTLDAYQHIEGELYASKPDTIVIISPHGSVLPDAFPLFISPKYRANLKEFGDLSTSLEFKSDLRLVEKLRRARFGKTPTPITGVTDEFLDYGATVPLFFLTAHIPNIPIVPLGISHRSIKNHFSVGIQIGEILKQTTKRVAVIGSADLSHTLTDAAPGGFSPEGKKFDEAIVQALRKDSRDAILHLEKKAVEAKACGLGVIALTLGIVNELNCTPKPLSYEGPFGVGYLVVNFNFR